jgi:phosphoserine phosphatase
MDDATALLVTVTGRDRPGLTSALCALLGDLGSRILDIEQVVIRDRLTLGLLVSLGGEEAPARTAIEALAARLGVDVEFEPMAAGGCAPLRHHPRPAIARERDRRRDPADRGVRREH